MSTETAGVNVTARDWPYRDGADWQLIMYGGALHGFTHANAKPGAIPGVAYDRLADIRSFAATRSFLTEIFADHGES
jgi:hypothetical protein